MPPSPCKGHSKLECTKGSRLSKCQYANGPKLSYCRKISDSTYNKRTGAARKIVKTLRKSKKKSASHHLSMTKHFEDVSKGRVQDSIRVFRTKCKLFPHPIEIFAKGGIQIPINHNYAKDIAIIWSKRYAGQSFMNNLEAKVNLAPNQHLFKWDYSNFEDPAYVGPWSQYKPGAVIAGVRFVEGTKRNLPHLVFFEVRIGKEGEESSAIVIDPNGSDQPNPTNNYRKELSIFFNGIPFEHVLTNYINRSDSLTSRVKKDLSELGFNTDERNLLGGYCATMASFFLVDYVCTNQWKSRDIGHFLRSTREWAFSEEENKTGQFYLHATDMRIVLIARYLACNMLRLLVPERYNEDLIVPRPVLRTVKIQHEIEDVTGETPLVDLEPVKYSVVAVTIHAGNKKIVTRTGRSLPMSSMNENLNPLGKRLF